jgi:hypothetical protein
MNIDLTFERAFEIQKEQLAHWKFLLNERTYSLLEKEIELKNKVGYKRPIDVFRGCDMSTFIQNIKEK